MVRQVQHGPALSLSKGPPPPPYRVRGRLDPPPCLRRSGFAQAGIEGGGYYWENFKYLRLDFMIGQK